MTYRHLLIFVHTHICTYTRVYVCTHTLKLYSLLDVKEIYHRKYVLGVHPLWPGVLPVSLAGCVLKLSQLMGTDPGAPVVTSPNPPWWFWSPNLSLSEHAAIQSQTQRNRPRKKKKKHCILDQNILKREKKGGEGLLRVREIDSFLTNEVKIIHSCPFFKDN